MTERDLRAQLVATARHLYERGHNAASDGNISVRLSDHELLCTPSGAHKGRLSPDQVVCVDFGGSALRVVGQGVPSSELKLHVALLQRFEKTQAVVHSHSPHATALSVADISLDSPLVPEAVLALGSIPTVPYASPTTTEVPDAVLEVAGEAEAFILARHGPVARGASLEEASMRVELLEHTAKITWLAHALGPQTPLPDSERAALEALRLGS